MQVYSKLRAGLLANVLKQFALNTAVICPGSRNAPLITALGGDPYFHCHSVIDERTAGYFALGLSLKTGKPTIVICTSGTAAVNLYPAVAEAFYQQVSLIVITADRPVYLENSLDGQVICQQKLYDPHTCYTGQLSEDESELSVRHDAAQIMAAIHACELPVKGPVHLNIPFSENLYDKCEIELPKISVRKKHLQLGIAPSVQDELTKVWETSQKKLIIIGQKNPDPLMDKALEQIMRTDPGTAVFADLTSNIRVKSAVCCIDGVLSSIENSGKIFPAPDIILYAGNSVISKKLKQVLRKIKYSRNIYVGTAAQAPDVFFSLTDHVCMEPVNFFTAFSENIISGPENTYRQFFEEHRDTLYSKTTANCRANQFSELNLVGNILQKLPDNTPVHIGNSLPVRLAQYFDESHRLTFYGNRGTGGIDGSVSSACGFSFLSENPNVLIVGDLSFLYDRNALTVYPFPKNLLIIVINNNGGGIFRVINGAADVDLPVREKLLVAASEHKHPVVEYTAKAHGLTYCSADTKEAMGQIIDRFMSNGFETAVIAEVFPTVPSDKQTFNIFGD